MRRAKTGFTLVELLVAMAVLGLAVLALIRLGTAGVSSATFTRTAMLGDIVAENAVVDAMTQVLPPAYGKTTGTIINAGMQWTVTRIVSRTDDVRLMQISVDVRDADGRAAGSLTAFRGLE